MKVIDLYNLISNKEYDKLPTKIKLKEYDKINEIIDKINSMEDK